MHAKKLPRERTHLHDHEVANFVLRVEPAARVGHNQNLDTFKKKKKKKKKKTKTHLAVLETQKNKTKQKLAFPYP
jgi:hypothetical protein